MNFSFSSYYVSMSSSSSDKHQCSYVIDVSFCSSTCGALAPDGGNDNRAACSMSLFLSSLSFVSVSVSVSNHQNQCHWSSYCKYSHIHFHCPVTTFEIRETSSQEIAVSIVNASITSELFPSPHAHSTVGQRYSDLGLPSTSIEYGIEYQSCTFRDPLCDQVQMRLNFMYPKSIPGVV